MRRVLGALPTAFALYLLTFEGLFGFAGGNHHLRLAYGHVHGRCQHGTNERGDHEQPELAQRPPTDKDRRANAPCGVNGRILLVILFPRHTAAFTVPNF